MGLKRQKAELSLTYYYTNPDQSKNEDHGPQNKIKKKKNIKKTNKKKKEIYSLTDRRQYSPTITIHAAPHPTLSRIDQNLYFLCHIFHVTAQLLKKQKKTLTLATLHEL